MPTSNYSGDLREAVVAAHNDVLTSEMQAQAGADVAFATVTRAFEDRNLAVAGLSDARSLTRLSTVIDEQAEWYKLTAQNVLALGQVSAAKAATAAAQASAAATAAKQAADALGNLTDKLGGICNRTDGIGGSIDEQARQANAHTKTAAEVSQRAKYAAMTVSVSAAESKAPAVLSTLQTLMDEFTGLAASARTTWTNNQTRTAAARKQLSDTLVAEAKASLAYAQSESDFRARGRTLALVDRTVHAPTATSADGVIQATLANVPTHTVSVAFVALEWSEAQQFTYRDYRKLAQDKQAGTATPTQTPATSGKLATGTRSDQASNTHSATIANDASGEPLKLGSTYCVFAARSVEPSELEYGHDTLLSCPSDPVVVKVGLSWAPGASAPTATPTGPQQFQLTSRPAVASTGAAPDGSPSTAQTIEYRVLIVREEVLQDYMAKHAAEEISLVSALNPAYYYVWADNTKSVTFDPTAAVPAYVDIFGEPIDMTGASYRALVLAVSATGDEPELLLSDPSGQIGTATPPDAASTEQKGTHEKEI